MGRVEQRIYRRRKRRLRRILLTLAVLLIGAALWWTRGGTFHMQTVDSATPTPPAKSAKAETREVTLNADSWYAIQTGVYSTESAANDRAAAFTSRGAPGTVIADGTKWRVFIACYGSEEDATAVRTRLGDRQQVDTYLYTWTMPEVRLRLTGRADQLDLVEAGCTLMTSAAAALRDAATLLDAAQLTTQEAAARADELYAQMQLWAKEARGNFGANLPDLIRSLLKLTDAFQTRAAAIRSAATTATDLSAALKTNAMGFYDECVRFRKALSAQ